MSKRSSSAGSKVGHKVWLLCVAACSLGTTGFSQSLNEPFSIGRQQDIAARPMALGGSYTAVASDGSALFYNPAGLSAVKKHEWIFSLEQSYLSSTGRADGFPSRSLDQQTLRIQSFGYLLPIPTERGGLTFAFGFYRPRTFSDLISYDDKLSATRGTYRYEADGTQNQYRVGMGLDIAPDITFGLAVGYLGGGENIDILDSGEAGYARTFHGLSLEPALMIKITPRLKLGFSLVAWEKIFDLNEVYQVKGESSQEADYQVDHPFQAKVGLAYQGPSYLLAADYKVNGWSEYSYGLDNAASLTKADYKNESIFSIGGEKFIEPINTVLRAGYTYNTLPERSFEPAYNLHRISAGVGVLLNGSLAVDAAYSYAFWELSGGDGLYLENNEQRGLLTFSYRY